MKKITVPIFSIVMMFIFSGIQFSCEEDANEEIEICNNNIDDDLDGFIDCDDNDCLDFIDCSEESVEICNNSIDDDSDGFIDCDDNDCLDSSDC
jgi:hypothetical protein